VKANEVDENAERIQKENEEAEKTGVNKRPIRAGHKR
jgi:hypothetical protein